MPKAPPEGRVGKSYIIQVLAFANISKASTTHVLFARNFCYTRNEPLIGIVQQVIARAADFFIFPHQVHAFLTQLGE